MVSRAFMVMIVKVLTGRIMSGLPKKACMWYDKLIVLLKCEPLLALVNTPNQLHA